MHNCVPGLSHIYPISVLGIQGWGKPASMEPWRAQPAPTGRVESACCSGSEGEVGCFRGATAENQGTRRGFPLQCMRWHKWKLLAAEVAKGEWSGLSVQEGLHTSPSPEGAVL